MSAVPAALDGSETSDFTSLSQVQAKHRHLVQQPVRGRTVCTVAVVALAFVGFLATTLDAEQQRRLWNGGPLTLLGTQSSVARQRYPARHLNFFYRWLDNVKRQATFRERTERTQRERQRKLAGGCRQLRGASVHSASQKSFVFNIPSPLRLTYCAIPKCSTTTWFTFLERATGNQCTHGTQAFECALSKFHRPSSVNAFQRTSLVVVRDPWHRLVSAYEDKYVARRFEPAISCYKRHGKSIKGEIPVTFAEFVRCILEDYRDGRKLNIHYAPQHWQCWLCKGNYSYIAKLETLTEDFRYLATYVFPARNYTAYRANFLARHQRPINNTSSRNSYEYFYRSLEPADTAALVHMYRTDAELLGYPLHPLP